MVKLKKEYFEKECSRLSVPGAHKISFSALKHLNTPNKSAPWSILQLYDNLNERETLEELADFFNKISSEFVELTDEDIPVTYDREIYSLDPITIEQC